MLGPNAQQQAAYATPPMAPDHDQVGAPLIRLLRHRVAQPLRRHVDQARFRGYAGRLGNGLGLFQDSGA